MNLDGFVGKYIGKSLLWQPSAARENLRGECVQLACYFVAEVWAKPVIWANAAEWFYGGAFPEQYSRFSISGGPPPPGSLVVWDRSLPNSGGAGHIAICLEARPGSPTFVSLDQNWGGKYVHKVTHTYNNVIGWILPAGGKGAGAPEGVKMTVIPDSDAYYLRYGRKAAGAIRGRHLTREEFRKHLVGLTDLRALEVLLDNPEADAVQQAQDIGLLALRDRWADQIHGLEAIQTNQQGIINQLNQAITKLTEDGTKDTEATRAGVEDIALLTAQLETAHDELEDLRNVAARNEKQVVEGFLKRVWHNLFRR